MNRHKVTADSVKEEFWEVVEACLREFHRKSANWSASEVRALRGRVAALPANAMELYYHSEPFDVACRIAAEDLKVEDHLERYLAIRDRALED